MKLYLVRHGEAEGSAGRAVGHTDLPLSALGARDVEALAASWQGPAPSSIFSSDLRRAVESARILAARLGGAHIIDPRLREVSFGDWDGRSWNEVYETDRQRFDAWSERWWDLAPPGGESFADLLRRVFDWYRALGDEETVLAVAHGGSIRALLSELLELPRDHAFHLQVSPARVSAVEVEEGTAKLLFLDQERFAR
ncbi:MAG TPA: histidine phosphatase family protein [Thermoanaerobaculia bacterium]|nr:histidine phosphatase family protein [Thermoanaerobaculia bacterium]